MSMKYFIFLIALSGVFSAVGQKSSSEKKIAEFDAYVARVMQEWDVPGMAITVVKDGKVLFKKGYGIRELGRPDPVDTQTLFSCASTTKAMTAAVLGMLVDEGKLSWDDPVSKFIPELRLYDPYVTRELRVRDLLLHNTGLSSTDFFWGVMNISVDEVIKRLVLVEPSYSFRAGYEYQNTMYVLAGLVTERVTGKKWADVMNERLFKPLSMNQTVPGRGLSNSSNMTKPHYPVKGERKVLDYINDSEIGAAGGVWSNVDDMSKWLIAMLDSSKYTGGRLVSRQTYEELFRPQTIVPSGEYPTFSILKPQWITYGLGWYQHDYKGKKVNFHTGSLPGLTAIIGLIPEEKIGVYIFGNYDHAEVRHALLYKTFDWFALGGSRDWNGEFKVLYSSRKKDYEDEVQDFEKQRVSNTKPTFPLDAYSGKYSSELLGSVDVRVANGKLTFDINDKFLVAELPHWHYDTFYGPIGEAGQYNLVATFGLSAEGKIATLNIDGLEFERKEISTGD
jgi:CubicO group peptidase (beta-lactamase class C family)